MLRLIRFLVVILPLLALLAGGSASAWAGKGLHKCEGMAAGVVMDDCMRGEAGVNPECPPLDCLSPQTFLLPQSDFVPKIVIRFRAASLPRDEVDLGGLSGPPDLRPPIA